MNTVVPAYRFRTPVRKKINALRVTVDIYGLLIFKVLGPFMALIPWMHWILAIYPIMATITILTVDPTRFPEAATTRIAQKKAWAASVTRIPMVLLLIAATALFFHLPLHTKFPSIGALIGVAINVYLAEWFWRNVFQPTIRKAGLSRSWAILTQSILFALCVFFTTQSLGVAVSSLFLGVYNGWSAHKFRSLWPGAVLYLVWQVILVGA